MKKYLFIILFFLSFFPFQVFAQDLASNADAAILIEANSGKILFEKEKDKRVSVASMTKMVAQIIIMDEIEKGNISLDDIVQISQNASNMGGSQIYLEAGEKMTVRDLLKGISVASGNDATVAMAEYVSGSEEKFVSRMNDYVQQMGLKNTHFVNSTGLDEENHYSSSYDMAMIARELILQHPKILEFSSIYEDYLRENTNRKFWLVNTNKLIRFYDGADGLKTGHTDLAGYCLAATAKRGDLRLIAIVLGENDSKIRNQETMELLDYGFQSIKLNCILSKGTIVDEISFAKAVPSKVNVVLKNNLCVIEDKDDTHSYQFDIHYSDYHLPLEKEKSIGEIYVLLNHQRIMTGSLTVEEAVYKQKFIEFYKNILLNYLYGTF